MFSKSCQICKACKENPSWLQDRSVFYTSSFKGTYSLMRLDRAMHSVDGQHFFNGIFIFLFE
jgi:hypothetical protein